MILRHEEILEKKLGRCGGPENKQMPVLRHDRKYEPAEILLHSVQAAAPIHA